MTDQERRLLVAAAQAVLQSARWGLHTGIGHEDRAELSAALEALLRIYNPTGALKAIA